MSQISLTFPDGNIRQYPAGVTPAEVAASIAPSLAKAAISAQVNGAHWDLAWPIPADARLAINTLKDEAPAPKSSSATRTPTRRTWSMRVLRAAMPYSPSPLGQKRPWWSLVCRMVSLIGARSGVAQPASNDIANVASRKD